MHHEHGPHYSNRRPLDPGRVCRPGRLALRCPGRAPGAHGQAGHRQAAAGPADISCAAAPPRQCLGEGDAPHPQAVHPPRGAGGAAGHAPAGRCRGAGAPGAQARNHHRPPHRPAGPRAQAVRRLGKERGHAGGSQGVFEPGLPAVGDQDLGGLPGPVPRGAAPPEPRRGSGEGQRRGWQAGRHGRHDQAAARAAGPADETGR